MAEQNDTPTPVDPKTGILKPEIDTTVRIDNYVLKGSGVYADGEIFTDVVYRAPKRLWLTEMKGTVEGFKAWMSKHDPRLRTAEEWNVTLVREEATDEKLYGQKPEV